MNSQAERVATWPRISATVEDTGAGSITINGTERPCAAGSVNQLRTGIIAQCVTLASRLGRAVRLTVTDAAGTWLLAVRPDGIVQEVAPDGTVGPEDGLLPLSGPCRSCGASQPVTAPICAVCDAEEPHDVTASHRSTDTPPTNHLDLGHSG